MKARRLTALVVLLSAFVPALGRAQGAQGSDADKATARELTREGYAVLEKKDYAAAADLFARADALHHAPTVSVGLARARAGLGKLVSAQELYSLVVHEVLPPGASAPFVQAHEEAQRELDALAPRVPAVILRVTGPAAPRVSVDGEDVPRMALGVRRPVDPGKHVVKAVAPGFYPREATFVVAEGGAETVTLELQPDGTPQVVAPAPSEPTGPVAPPPPPPLVDARTRRLIGAVGLGVGGAGLVAGAIAGGVAVAKHGQLASACPAGRCVIGVPGSDGLPAEVSAYKTAGLVATTGLIAGGVIGVAGVVLFATAPRAGAVVVTPVVGLGYAGAQGTFSMKAILRAAALLAVALAAGSCTNLLGTFDLVCDTPCGTAADCPDPMSPCVETTCINGCCGTQDLADMTAVPSQPNGTCQRVVCDGAGNTTILVDDTNTPPGQDECHAGGCVAGVPAQADKTGGTLCSLDGGKVCGAITGAAAGQCVACNVTADCAGDTVCLANVCAPMSCMDLVKDGTETDVDCGGASCPGCGTGKACLVAHDCVSGVCTGGACAAPTCTDGVKNDTETDVDCGGGGCPPCVYGDKCLAPTDCASTFCVADRCGASVLATGQVGAHGIALDASTVTTVHSVYWTDDASAGTIRRVLADGTGVEVSLGNEPNPTGVAVATTAAAGAYLVWTNGAVTGGAVDQAIIGTATGPVVPTIAGALMAPGAIVADSANAYWVTAGALMQAPIGTAATGTNSLVRAMVTSPAGIAVHTADIYWTSGVASTGSVNKLAAGGTTSTVLASAQNNPGAIAVDHANVYWCNDVASTGAVMKLQLAPLGVPTVVASAQNQPISIAVDATFIYWATTASGAGTVSRAPISGTGATVVLVSGETSIAAIAVDNTFVYWTNPFDGTVKRVHK